MKFSFEGCTIEIKVTPEGSKKTDSFKSDRIADDISLALLHAANFCRGNGFDTSANYYLDLATAMMNK